LRGKITSLFSDGFKDELQKHIHDIDKSADGILINSDNFQALSFLQERYNGAAKCIYIDPPYNTGTDGFAYKDRYSHSSWLTLMHDRLRLANQLLKDGGFFQCSVSDIELYRGKLLLDSVFGEESLKTISIKMSTASGVKMASALIVGGVPKLKEYLLVAAKGPFKGYFIPKIDKEKWDDEYRWFIEGVSSEELEMLISGIDNQSANIETLNDIAQKIVIRNVNEVAEEQSVSRTDREDWKFKNAGRIVQIVTVTPGLRDLVAQESRGHHKPFLVVTTSRGNRYLVKRCDEIAATRPRLQVSFASDNLQTHPGDFWQDISTTGLDNEGGVDFKNGKKPLKLISRMLEAARAEGDIVLDYFAGSGTTVEAVINSWDLESDRTKVIACEADHDTFGSKTLARLYKSISSKRVSSFFKIIKLESYEDTLNNLELRRTNEQGDLLASLPAKDQDDYLLHYMLDVESRGSLLSVDTFKKPFDATLKVAVDSAGATEVRKIDLVETFNYLIGLTVKTMELATDRGYARVEGTLPSGESALILWRDCDRIGYEELMRFTNRFDLNSRDKTYDVIYVNGDHNIPAAFTENDADGGGTRTLKLRQIEPEFLERMFSVEDV
jgi:adenine-specific DNA-methyltransferase